MQEMATHLLRRLYRRRSNITALVFCIDDQVSKARGAMVQFAYICSMAYDGKGRMETVAKYIDAGDLEYHEPESDIVHEDTDMMWHMKLAKVKTSTAQ